MRMQGCLATKCKEWRQEDNTTTKRHLPTNLNTRPDKLDANHRPSNSFAEAILLSILLRVTCEQAHPQAPEVKFNDTVDITVPRKYVDNEGSKLAKHDLKTKLPSKMQYHGLLRRVLCTKLKILNERLSPTVLQEGQNPQLTYAGRAHTTNCTALVKSLSHIIPCTYATL